MAYCILRTAKLKTIGNISGSLAHTYRTINTPNADPSRTHLNDNSLPSHADALLAIKDKLPEKSVKRCSLYRIPYNRFTRLGRVGNG